MSETVKKDFQDLSVAEKAQLLFVKAMNEHKQGRLEEALKIYAQSVAYLPQQPDAYNNMAVALRKLKHYEAALACYRKSIALRDDHAGTYSNIGNVLNDLDRIDEALSAHAKAVELAPQELLYLYNYGLALRDAGQTDAALKCFDEVLERDPNYKDCRWDRALTYLVAGDLKAGFADYDARWDLAKSPPRRFRQPRWDGESLSGKRLFIHREQGFGDAIQYVRLLKTIKSRFGGTIILECQPELMRLFDGIDGVDERVVFGSKLPEFDCWIPLMSLGHLLSIDENNIPAPIPYLFAPDDSRFRVRPAPEGGLNIAFAWGGSPTHQNDRRRSVSLESFIPLAGYDGVTLFSLQKGDRSNDMVQTGAAALVIDAANEIQDFADSAAILSQMDLVITVDTSLAHLAGALGCPVWLLLPHSPDWRWMLGREDSPWYPQMQIFRQEKPGDWAGVFARVVEKLEEKLGQ